MQQAAEAPPAPHRGWSRRDALRLGGVGGLGVLGAAVLAACSDEDPVSVTGTTGPEQTTTTLPAPSDDDLVFLRTAESIELAALAMYREVLDGDRELGGDVREAANLFAAHHDQQAALLDRVLSEDGAEGVDEANATFESDVVIPGLEEATDDAALLELFRTVEQTLASAYVAAGGSLSRADLRADAVSIAGADARAVSYLDLLLEVEPLPDDLTAAEPFDAAWQLDAGEITSPEGGEAEDSEEASG